MRPNRMFFSQEAVDRWLEAGQVSLEGELLSLPGGPTFRLTSGLVFQAEVGSGVDPHDLCGRAKTVSEVDAMGGEVAPGSVLIGEQAYEVVDGFLGELVCVVESEGVYCGAAGGGDHGGAAAGGGEPWAALQRLVAVAAVAAGS